MEATPDAVIQSIQNLTGGFAPIALLAVGVSAITINSLNDNTAAYSLISSGIRLSRPVSAIVTGVLGYLMAVIGAGKFAALYSNYLLVLLYWISPWVAIVLTDWYLKKSKRQSYPQGWTIGATILLW